MNSRALGLSREMIAYALVSTAALAADVLIMTLLVKWLHVHYLTASMLSFTCGSVMAYVLCIRLVFKTRRLASARQEFAAFVLIGFAGLIANSVALHFIHEALEQSLVVSKLAAAAASFVTNYALRRLALFTKYSFDTENLDTRTKVLP